MLKVPFIDTKIKDLKIFEPKVWSDARGHFFESYNQKIFSDQGLNYNFIQDNQSKSCYGVLRGLHFQRAPHAQTKLVRVLSGKILDVAVDLRPESATYKQHVAIELSSENFKQILVPAGFAHGFVVLSKEAIIAYKCDQLYAPSYDAGIRYDDPELDIDWLIPGTDVILSDKDAKLPLLRDFK